jgi:PAS domain S-box-containing protein
MPPTLVEPGSNPDYGAAVLAEPALAALHASGAPAFVAKSDPPEVVWANGAAFALFETRNLTELSERLLGGRDPGATRLARLVRQGAPGEAPRLERVRFFFGSRAEVLTFSCRRGVHKSGVTLFAAATLGPRPAQKETFEREGVEASPGVPSSGDGNNVRSTGVTVDGLQAILADQFASSDKIRFVWHSDADDRLNYLSRELATVVGTSDDSLIGQALTDLADRLRLDQTGAFSEALARRDSFRGVELSWPVEGLDIRIPVRMGALPHFDSTRTFAGFRGFGVLDVGQIRAGLEQLVARSETAASSGRAEPAGVQLPDAPAASVVAAEPPTSSLVMEPVPLTHEHQNVIYLRPPPGHGDKSDTEEDMAAALSARGLISGQIFVAGRPIIVPSDNVRLSLSERNAFREIARALGAHVEANFAKISGVEAAEREERQEALIETLTDPTPEPRAPAVSEPSGSALADDLGSAVVHETRDRVADAASAMSNDVLELDGPDAPDAELAAMENAGAHERNIEAFVNAVPLGLAVVRAATPVFVNRHLLQLLGYSDHDSLHHSLDRIMRNLGSLKIEEETMLVFETADGERAFDCRAQPVDWNGASATLVTVHRSRQPEVAQRLKATEVEVRLKEAEARELHAILDTATDGVVVLDETGRVLSLNRSAEALFGYEQTDVTGEPLTFLLSVESHRAALEYLDGLKANGFASVLNDGREVMGRERQGGAIPMFMTIGRVGSGAVPKFCAVLRDMTQWKKAERELNDAKKQAERASALKSDFLAKISHEIRTPLNAILGFAEVIMEERFGPVGNDRYKDYLKDIHASGTHVMSLVNDLLDLSKIEAGKLELSFASVDANRVVRECVSLMQPQASSARVVVRQALAPRLPNIVADERSLRQIVLNLLSNAMKFNEPGGQVIVSTALTDAGHAVVRIRDTGIGMSEAEIEMALEPFRQITTAHRSTGTGLGLPLTKALVEANRASFTIKSRRTEGTLVEVAFPPMRVLAE